MGFLADLALRTQFLENFSGRFELLNKIWPYVGYHTRIDSNKSTLERKLEALCSLEADVKETLEGAEFRSGMKRKREVENWLRNVERKKNEVQEVKQRIGGKRYSLGPWWETNLEKHIGEVEELFERGKFSEDLVLDAQQNIRQELVTTTLVGRDSEGVQERMRECLKNDSMLRIGVYGDEGVGKTAILLHIHNKLLESSTIGCVCWITITSDFSIHKLQDDIAKEVRIDLSNDEDTRKRAAKLCKILRRKKSVLILDGLESYFDPIEVGIPIEVDGCKLVLGTRSLKVCRRMACQETIRIEPLPESEAESLFQKTLEGCTLPRNSEVEEIAKKIIKKCGGLPQKIICMAERLRGVDDVSEWRNTLQEL